MFQVAFVTIIVALVGMEWYIIRHTKINKWLPLLFVLILASPISFLFGTHLVFWPLIFMLLTLGLCGVEDWWKERQQKKHLSELQKTKIKDL